MVTGTNKPIHTKQGTHTNEKKHLKRSGDLFDGHPHVSPILASTLCVCCWTYLAGSMMMMMMMMLMLKMMFFMNLNLDMSTKNLSKCSGTNRAEVEIPLWHLPSRVHLGVIISIINIPNLASIRSCTPCWHHRILFQLLSVFKNTFDTSSTV